MTNMDKHTHILLTVLFYLTFGAGYAVLFILGGPNKWLTIGLFTAVLFLSSYSHYRYYSHVKVENQGKIFLIIEMTLIFAVIYLDNSDYEHVFILLLIGDCIFAYSYRYSFVFLLSTYLAYYLLNGFIYPRIGPVAFPVDYLEDLVIVVPTQLVLFITKYQISGKMKYDLLLDERDKAYKQLEISAEKIEAYAVKEERARIALMLHNSLGHMLVATNMSFQAEKMELVSKGQISNTSFADLERGIQRSMSLLRKTVEGDEDFLVSMSLIEVMDIFVSDIANNVGIRVEYSNEGLEDVPESLKLVVYNTVLESVTNALKHAEGTCICIDLKGGDSVIAIEVKDNGKGFDQLERGYGIQRLKEQIEKFGGTYYLLSEQGCVVRAEIPF